MLVPSLLLVTALGAFNSTRPDTPAGKADIREVRQEVGDLSGYYTCKGAEVGGKSYTGIAVLTKKMTSTRLLGWSGAVRHSQASPFGKGTPWPPVGSSPANGAWCEA